MNSFPGATLRPEGRCVIRRTHGKINPQRPFGVAAGHPDQGYIVMTIPCPSWRDAHLSGAGLCTQGKFGGTPSQGTCRHCLGFSTTPATQLHLVLTEEQQTRATQHRTICESCEHAKSFTRLTVRCNHCGCAGLSLIKGKCPLKKWNE